MKNKISEFEAKVDTLERQIASTIVVSNALFTKLLDRQSRSKTISLFLMFLVIRVIRFHRMMITFL